MSRTSCANAELEGHSLVSALIPHFGAILLAPGFQLSSLLCVNHSLTKWSDQIVLITGGSSGIGALLARTLSRQGVRVVVLDVKEGTPMDGVAWYRCDVSNKTEVDEAAERIRVEVRGFLTCPEDREAADSFACVRLAHYERLEIQRWSLTMQVLFKARSFSTSLRRTSTSKNSRRFGGYFFSFRSDFAHHHELCSSSYRTFGVNVLSHFWTIKAFLPAMIASGKPCHIVRSFSSSTGSA